MKTKQIKKVLLPTSIVLALGGVLATCVAPQAHAGFVADFVSSAQQQTNVTKAGIEEAGALNIVTGGGFVYKTPRKEFVPFSVTPPSLKAGCGGIDVFLGAFSIPSKDEFVSFLKSVGTALPGLAFQLALQTMAPDLNEMVGRYADLIRSYTNRYTDSCSAAQALLYDTGLAQQLQKTVHTAANNLRNKGQAADQSDADWLVRSNGAKAIESAPTVKDASGNEIDAPEMNLTWSLLSSGKWASGSLEATELKEIMMTLTGTTIFTKAGDGDDAVLTSRMIAGADLLPILFGESDNTAAMKKLKCKDNNKCLEVVETVMTEMNLVEELMKAANAYRTALSTRKADAVTDSQLVLLAASSGVPLIRILNMASLSRYSGIAEDLIKVYVEAAAYEMLASAVHGLASDVRTALASSAASGISKVHLEHVEGLQKRLSEIEAQLNDREDKVMQSMMRASQLVSHLEHIERSLMSRQSQTATGLIPTSSWEK